jgi:hypothetical protein
MGRAAVACARAGAGVVITVSQRRSPTYTRLLNSSGAPDERELAFQIICPVRASVSI